MKPQLKTRLFLLLTAAWLLMQPLPAWADSPIYVDASAPCSPCNGATWATAYPTVQDALAVAGSGDEIWVAAGVYYPDEGVGQTGSDRTAIFTLINGVAVYGGFAGTETSRDARDWEAHPTILSGDIDHDAGGADPTPTVTLSPRRLPTSRAAMPTTSSPGSPAPRWMALSSPPGRQMVHRQITPAVGCTITRTARR